MRVLLQQGVERAVPSPGRVQIAAVPKQQLHRRVECLAAGGDHGAWLPRQLRIALYRRPDIGQPTRTQGFNQGIRHDDSRRILNLSHRRGTLSAGVAGRRPGNVAGRAAACWYRTGVTRRLTVVSLAFAATAGILGLGHESSIPLMACSPIDHSYQVLGIDASASPDEVKRAHRDLMRSDQDQNMNLSPN